VYAIYILCTVTSVGIYHVVIVQVVNTNYVHKQYHMGHMKMRGRYFTKKSLDGTKPNTNPNANPNPNTIANLALN